MRLIDRSPEFPATYHKSVNGRDSHRGHSLLDASAADIRYVLDLPASHACGDLIRNGDGLFEADNPLFRMPAQSFWVELFEEHSPEHWGPKRRLGYLVVSEADGRSGTIIPFTETDEGLCRQLPCVIEFDLDNILKRRTGAHSIRHAEMTHLSDLFDHCLLCPDNEAMKALKMPNNCSTNLTQLAQGTWYALPLLFAFTALLNSPKVIETRQSDLYRLNRERIKRGRAPLLDHVEVRLSLGGSANSEHVGSDFRTTPRLHVVRGHVVRRNGKTFWRQSHLRGDSEKAIVSKTVRVTAGKAVRDNAAKHVRASINTG